ncbi:MAG: septum formation initiator family protein [Caldiserica bacterium]|nr:septum formation initiator family protein [Caldisericota bacterium]
MRQQKRGHTLSMHKVMALVACFIVGYLIWSTVAALAYLGKADREATRTFAELQRVSAQTLEQQKSMEYHATKSYIEKVAREDMLMSRKGDTVVLFPVDRALPEPTPLEPAGLPRALSQLIKWVKGWF